MTDVVVVPDRDIAPSVMFDVPPQGGARIGEHEHRELSRLQAEVKKRLTLPIAASILPHRIGRSNSVSVHLCDSLENTLDILVTVTGNISWPDDQDYQHGIRWYISVPDTVDAMWLVSRLANLTGCTD
ncbi:hypothetical protein [Dickeya poaceiphila]|nr:hypothetical protein [Dickeya poaceiphila]